MEILILIEIVLNVALIIAVLNLNNTVSQAVKIKQKEKTKEFKREHNAISQSNFASILNGRTNVYDKYKNESGLYEPVQGRSGINLNKDSKGE